MKTLAFFFSPTKNCVARELWMPSAMPFAYAYTVHSYILSSYFSLTRIAALDVLFVFYLSPIYFSINANRQQCWNPVFSYLNNNIHITRSFGSGAKIYTYHGFIKCVLFSHFSLDLSNNLLRMQWRKENENTRQRVTTLKFNVWSLEYNVQMKMGRDWEWDIVKWHSVTLFADAECWLLLKCFSLLWNIFLMFWWTLFWMRMSEIPTLV